MQAHLQLADDRHRKYLTLTNTGGSSLRLRACRSRPIRRSRPRSPISAPGSARSWRSKYSPVPQWHSVGKLVYVFLHTDLSVTRRQLRKLAVFLCRSFRNGLARTTAPGAHRENCCDARSTRERRMKSIPQPPGGHRDPCSDPGRQSVRDARSGFEAVSGY